MKPQQSLAELMGNVDHALARQVESAGEVAGPELSIVIPAYNEEERLPRTVLNLLHWARDTQLDCEVVISDDGSTDRTLEVSKLLASTSDRIVVLTNVHKGKGAAVRLGMLNARGRNVLFMDADGATPLTEIDKLLQSLANGADVAVGSRVATMPGQIRVETSFLRQAIGRTFALLVNLCAVQGINDTQCGFKMFKGECLQSIFSRQKLDGFAFDVEILYLAKKMGLTVEEVPVNWYTQAGSKVNLVLDPLKMFCDILKIRFLHLGTR